MTETFNLLDIRPLDADSYKFSHWLQYPPETRYVQSYIESRGGKFDRTVFFGLQMWLKMYADKPFTKRDVKIAKIFCKVHGVPFNEEGFMYIVEKHGGYWPVRIKAVPEGTVLPTSNALVVVENTDPEAAWVTSFIETSIHRAVWYPTTVATISWRIKQIIREYMEKTASEEAMAGLPFMLHDFGARGVSSLESAAIGGAAHLVNFMGSDTVSGILHAMQFYGKSNVNDVDWDDEESIEKFFTENMAAFSIPAAEHSSITTWLKEGEADAYRNMLKQFGGKYPNIAVVSDSYDIFNAVENIWGDELKEEVIKCGSMLVVRPDSGDPAEVVLKVALLLEKAFGSTINEKGYKVLNHVRIIQGDGIEEESIVEILEALTTYKFSAENVFYGMGGGLLQQCDRDWLEFAMKASAAEVEHNWRDVFKDPVTSKAKHSKKGRLELYRDLRTGEFITGREAHGADAKYELMLETVWEDGKLLRDHTFDEVRANSEKVLAV